MDTLSHALESIWNKNANPITIEYSIVAAKLIVDNLEELSNDLQNINLRDIVMRACMLAGLSFSNTQTAAAHAMSYYITMHKDIDHGIACSFTLPMLIDNIVGKYEFVDQALIKIFGDLSSLKIRELLSRLSVSTDFIDYGISNEELNKMKLLMDDKRARNSLAFF